MDVTKKVRFNYGYLVSFLVIFFPAIAWLYGYTFERDFFASVSTALAKITAFSGMAMFAWSLILSGRFKIFDSLFGGLDKMYGAHRLFGTLSMALLLIHPVALTLSNLPTRGMESLRLWLAFDSLAILLGMISLYGLIIFGAWSAVTKVQHETFVLVHKVLGLLFVLGAIHAFMAGSVLSSNPVLYWYMLVLSMIATAVFIHYSFLADVLHKSYAYKVESVTLLPGDVYDVRLKPKRRIVRFQPGQFVYIKFDRLAIHGYHPFTIASGKHSSELQFMIKSFGDFTASLGQLKEGDSVAIKGPYGRFFMEDRRYEKHIWIAGGIGITPFLSKARSLSHNKQCPQIDLLYATKTKNEAVVLKNLENMQHSIRSFHVTHLRENKFGIISLHDIKEHFGTLEDRAIFICGPPVMLAAYQKQAEQLGVESQLHYEEFSY